MNIAMNTAGIASLLLSAALATAPAHALDQAAMAQAQGQVHDLASQFVKVWDRNAATSPADFVKDFKATIGARFPAFYGIERYEGRKTQAQRDAEIAAAYTEFPALRDAYIAKVETFARELPAHVKSFKAAFPDYPQASDIWFVHSLGEMDGGKRRLDGRLVFIFGADLMTKVHGKGHVAPFFHHELFHDYQVLECKEEKMWMSLWREGMAGYVAKALNPSATEAELGFDLPANMARDTDAQMPRALEHLQANLDSNDQEVYSGLFLRRGDKTGMPARRGYYLGYLVAQEAAKRYDLQTLARLDCATARDFVFSAVERLRGAAAAGMP
ncbi:hypothetical protein [Massilia niastensis]|uniref:hypothetical protein n=1 Tax=Massilia niastensis TaxID=544911 RepID=UPI0003A84476|nr:hypothetical protein [Massilia niastensis]